MIDRYLSAMRQWYIREQFIPTALGIFCSPLYILRRGLAAGLRRHADKLNGVLLDFGCGTKPYRSLIDVNEYVGIEIESNRSRYTEHTIEAFYDGKFLPFPSEHFDSILTSEVLEHVFNIEEILSDLWRVLRPGGVMIATVPFVWGEHEAPHDCARYTSFGIRDLLEKCGFRVEAIEKSTNAVETIFQLGISYIAETMLPSRGIVRVMLVGILIGPLTLLALACSALLPENSDLFHNNIVVARKVIAPGASPRELPEKLNDAGSGKS